jgi:hypothetical protein
MDSACIDPGIVLEMISEVTIAPIGDGGSLVVACFGQHMVAAPGRKVIWSSAKNSEVTVPLGYLSLLK